jgi:hypothetical protein
MVRVSLPAASSVINPPLLDPPPAEKPPQPSGWLGVLMSWGSAVLAFITGLWS